MCVREQSKRSSPPEHAPGTGRVTHDDRGNAVWEWVVDVDDDATGVSGPLRLADTGGFTQGPRGSLKLRPKVAASGYNPYESGLLQPEARPVKRDLRALSRWIEQRRTRASDQ